MSEYSLFKIEPGIAIMLDRVNRDHPCPSFSFDLKIFLRRELAKIMTKMPAWLEWIVEIVSWT